MDYNFRPAVAADLGLFIGLAGGTDSGKTYSAMLLAEGIVGPGNRFAVIDTENRRASHYANRFAFDVFDLAPPYRSSRYEAAAKAAVAAGYKAIVVDSVSHEHDGEGGYLDMQAEDLAQRVERAMKKDPSKQEWKVIEALTPSSWIAPKRERKRMMQTLLNCSTSIPIIFCFRAEEKVFQSKDGKLVALNPPEWAPICGKGMPFEMTAFFLLKREQRGVPMPIKLQEQHAALFPLGKPLDSECGRRIAAWAKGKAASTTTTEGFITPDQVAHLETRCQDEKIEVRKLREKIGVERLAQIPAADYTRAMQWIDKVIEARSGART